MELIIWACILFVGWKGLKFAISAYIKNNRRKYLMNKYGDSELVSSLMNRLFWQGQTAEQLLDSLGQPEATDRKILKSKTKETWKYHEVRKNQFLIRVFIEDDIVVGWDRKES